MRKIILTTMILWSGIFLGGCQSQTKESAVVVKTGEIMTKIGDDFVLNENGETTTLSSTKVNLDGYMKKKVEVKGMYSGTTLYVDEVKERL